MLIYGENTSRSRYALIAQGEQIHVSSYPPVWPTRPPNEAGRYNLAAAIRIRAGAHSFEGKLFNIVASACLDRSLLDALLGLDPAARETLETSPRGSIDADRRLYRASHRRVSAGERTAAR
jgi:aliphatic nitrilase